ncbi:zinc carboxypeptidase [Polaribacter reichenbachii]|uniref:Zinc carboxypeptidase n=1 Tax=Polaribacter reichenbachii TaxID=996801 RepID=A0A1B8U1L1_9FLAO|nr:M14 metallopeptidase family protein [Polaribacter reichenbachii]APZ47302.1 zinc carboxypeptidase [Polaribacter reichenbachii]AUC17943.1 zinc carboxypeptidase [Polaribacter reichenbachii]OBY65732.1 zinc carboxypeptidase [Polaribacter reichenbachii]
MNILSPEILKSIFKAQKETELFGKWITFKDIEKLLKKHLAVFKIHELGFSEQERPIYTLQIGTGKKKILLWSQMHGNESTGTKALFDLFNYFSTTSDEILETILKECTLLFIPMLNPDGAQAYTRINANEIDLNRDAVDRIAKESKLLRNTLEQFNPQFCFNLHDQRTIFGVEGTKNPATISFLAPSEEETRAITEGRKETMNVIVAMNLMLQQMIPNFVGRYTDEFYPTATGDNFQKLGYNTILIESGHYPDDYPREISREYTFYSILQGIYHIAISDEFSSYLPYFDIPNNAKIFYDVIHKYTDNENNKAYQYVDKIVDNNLVSELNAVEEKDIHGKFGHNEIVFEDNIV